MCLRVRCGVTFKQSFANSMNVSLYFDVGIRERHSTLLGKYEFSFTIACKYLNSGKSRVRLPAVSNNDTTFFTAFAFDLSKIKM